MFAPALTRSLVGVEEDARQWSEGVARTSASTSSGGLASPLSLFKATQTFSTEKDQTALLQKLMGIVLEVTPTGTR